MQGPVLQSLILSESPIHSDPFSDGEGLLQALLLVAFPPPHFSVHEDHEVQNPH